MEMDKIDDPTVRTIGLSTFFISISISFFLTKYLIQTRRNYEKRKSYITHKETDKIIYTAWLRENRK